MDHRRLCQHYRKARALRPGLPASSRCGTLPPNDINPEDTMKKILLPLAFAVLGLPTAASADLPKDVQDAIAKMGHVNDPKTAPLFAPFHKAGVPSDIRVTRDLAFGSDPAQKLDMFTSGQGTG